MKRVLLLLLLLGFASAAAPAAIDPFYRNRMESGFRAFEQGNWEEAAHQLRIACFGHLDEPIALAEGLVRLAVVEVNLGDEDAFRRVFSRLAELEERFAAYSSAQVPDSVRQQFESQAARLVPAQSLRAAAGFRSIAERADVQRLAAMPPDQRRAELQSRIEAEPERADWMVEMARLELAVRRPQSALEWLDRLPTTATELPPATCLRQQAASESSDCNRVDLSQPFCRDVPATVVEFRLHCLVDAERWPEAAGLLAELSPELRGRRRITRLERRVRKNIATVADSEQVTSPPSIESAEATVPAPEPPDAEPALAEAAPIEAAPIEVAPTEAATDPHELERLRQRLASSATSDELASLMSEVEVFVDRHPASRQAYLLAAEIAYLQSDWPVAIQHFQQAGALLPDEVHLAFYQAVALYESGEPLAAAEVLRPVASRLERTSFVDAYVDRILAPGI